MVRYGWGRGVGRMEVGFTCVRTAVTRAHTFTQGPSRGTWVGQRSNTPLEAQGTATPDLHIHPHTHVGSCWLISHSAPPHVHTPLGSHTHSHPTTGRQSQRQTPGAQAGS